MVRYVAALALLGAVLADGTGHHHADHGAAAAPSAGGYAAPADTGYAAPASSYGAPQNDYAAPTYDAPSSYGAPQSDYAAPTYDAPTYDAPTATGYDAPSYNAIQDATNGLDLSKITELLPLFVAVFAAIIIAQLVAPLFAAIAAPLGGILAIFGPIRQLKFDAINAILNPLGLALGNVGVCPNAGRSFDEHFGEMNLDTLTMIEMANNLYQAVDLE